MDLLAGYGDVGDDNSATNSPKDSKVKIGNTGGVGLENEWLSFEKMIAPGGNQGDSDVDKSKYLVDGVVAYPGMAMLRKQSTSEVELEVQSSESDSDEETEKKHDDDTEKNGKDGEEEDAFLKLRKQVKARDRSSSSDDSSDSSSDSSRSPVSKRGSLSPPHLSPVNSVKSHGSDPPELLHSESVLNEEQPEKEEEKVEAAEKNGDRRKDKERKDPIETDQALNLGLESTAVDLGPGIGSIGVHPEKGGDIKTRNPITKVETASGVETEKRVRTEKEVGAEIGKEVRARTSTTLKATRTDVIVTRTERRTRNLEVDQGTGKGVEVSIRKIEGTEVGTERKITGAGQDIAAKIENQGVGVNTGAAVVKGYEAEAEKDYEAGVQCWVKN